MRRTYRACRSLSLMIRRSPMPFDLLNESMSTWKYAKLNRQHGPFRFCCATCWRCFWRWCWGWSTCSPSCTWSTAHVECWLSAHHSSFTIACEARFRSSTSPSIPSTSASREVGNGMICGISVLRMKNFRFEPKALEPIQCVRGRLLGSEQKWIPNSEKTGVRKKGQKKTIFILLFVYDINYRMEADRVLANWHENPYQLLIFFCTLCCE